jgi:hypothetical protein
MHSILPQLQVSIKSDKQIQFEELFRKFSPAIRCMNCVLYQVHLGNLQYNFEFREEELYITIIDIHTLIHVIEFECDFFEFSCCTKDGKELLQIFTNFGQINLQVR